MIYTDDYCYHECDWSAIRNKREIGVIHPDMFYQDHVGKTFAFTQYGELLVEHSDVIHCTMIDEDDEELDHSLLGRTGERGGENWIAFWEPVHPELFNLKTKLKQLLDRKVINTYYMVSFPGLPYQSVWDILNDVDSSEPTIPASVWESYKQLHLLRGAEKKAVAALIGVGNTLRTNWWRQSMWACGFNYGMGD